MPRYKGSFIIANHFRRYIENDHQIWGCMVENNEFERKQVRLMNDKCTSNNPGAVVSGWDTSNWGPFFIWIEKLGDHEHYVYPAKKTKLIGKAQKDAAPLLPPKDFIKAIMTREHTPQAKAQHMKRINMEKIYGAKCVNFQYEIGATPHAKLVDYFGMELGDISKGEGIVKPKMTSKSKVLHDNEIEINDDPTKVSNWDANWAPVLKEFDENKNWVQIEPNGVGKSGPNDINVRTGGKHKHKVQLQSSNLKVINNPPVELALGDINDDKPLQIRVDNPQTVAKQIAAKKNQNKLTVPVNKKAMNEYFNVYNGDNGQDINAQYEFTVPVSVSELLGNYQLQQQSQNAYLNGYQQGLMVSQQQMSMNYDLQVILSIVLILGLICCVLCCIGIGGSGLFCYFYAKNEGNYIKINPQTCLHFLTTIHAELIKIKVTLSRDAKSCSIECDSFKVAQVIIIVDIV